MNVPAARQQRQQPTWPHHQRVWLHLYSAAETAQAHHQKLDNIKGCGASMSGALEFKGAHDRVCDAV